MRDPWQVSLIFTMLISFWSITAGRALRPVWSKPTIAFLLRQPISHWQWVWYLLPSLWIAFLPIVSIWWLAPHYAHPAVHYSGFVGLSWTIFLGASFHGLASVKLIAIGTAAVAILIFGYAYQPGVAYLAIIVTIFLLPFAITGIKHQLVQSTKISPSHLVSVWPIIAIVRRDLLCLWRLERKSLFSLFWPGVAVALMMFALRMNGQVSGREAFGKTFSVGPMNLVVNRGVIHLKGPNGGGKTTLLRAMGGELLPSRGSVCVNGQDVHSVIKARRHVALVTATPELPDFLTVTEAYEFSASLRGIPNWDGKPYCEALELEPTLLLGHASAGQRSKAELICGLAGDPAVLLLDETFAHLDKHSAVQLSQWIGDWSTSRVIVLAHHGSPPVSIDEVLDVPPVE